MSWNEAAMAAALNLQRQRQQQRTQNSHDLLQHGHENPAKSIRGMLDDCAQRAQDNAGMASLAREDVRQALMLRHPGAADGQSYLQAFFDAVSFLYMRVTSDPSLDAHWIRKQRDYLLNMINEAVHNVISHGHYSLEKRNFKLRRLRPC
ncbi:hypothetical protein Rt10032_c05g2533 [Rhodotorula toruloides]|uniref:Uncharacterized protein n=1 Tax=Rhodotorula toruloides TaxID=5286 RepID=A0A511KF06_RHOTO|nr:hypothetical protein Rt10032_c05g2533 [Rhodotorula toruloides]